MLGFQALTQGDFAVGHADLALNFDASVSLISLRKAMFSRMAALLVCHPGLDWENLSSVVCYLLQYRSQTVDFVPQIKRVNWLILIPNATASRAGRA